MRKLITIAAAIAAAATAAVPAVANADAIKSNSLSYELDNGSQWTLQKNAAAISTTFADKGYADAGVVVDLGPLSSLSGIHVKGSNVQDNIWIGNGPSAYTPGTHNLNDPSDFAYGFDQGDGQSFYMQGSSPDAGQVRTLAQLQGEYPDAEAYAWVGVVYSGSNVSGSMSSVNGQSVGNRTMSITNNADGTTTAAIH